MTPNHAVWSVRVRRTDGYTRLEKRIVPLPRGIALVPNVNDQLPQPARPPTDGEDGQALFHVYDTSPGDIYEKLFELFSDLVLVYDADLSTGQGTIDGAFERWVLAHTTITSLDSATLRDVVSLPAEPPLTIGPPRRYDGVAIDEGSWLYHCAQQP